MRVAFVEEVTAHTRATPSTRRTRRIARSLAERGHEVTVFCARWWDGDHDTFEHHDVTYRALVSEPSGDPSTRFALRLPLALRRNAPDVVHATYPPARHVLAAKVGGTLARAPLVVDWYGERDSAFDGYGRSLTGLKAYGRHLATRVPDRIVTPTRTVKTRVRELGADGADVRVVPNGINLSAIERTEAANVTDIVYSRSLDEDANLESLLLALAELRDRGWKAAIVGDGPERERYERQARDLRIDDRVTFVGNQPLAKRVAAFKGAHVYVQTARRESFPTDLLRAMASGCVGVVEYHVDSSAHELVEHQERGFRTTSEDELTDAIAKAAELPRMEHDEAFERYEESAIVDEYLDCYREAGESFGLL